MNRVFWAATGYVVCFNQIDRGIRSPWKGYREASRRLHVAQPAISQTVSDLEPELELKLFSRAKRVAKGEIGKLSIGFPRLIEKDRKRAMATIPSK